MPCSLIFFGEIPFRGGIIIFRLSSIGFIIFSAEFDLGLQGLDWLLNCRWANTKQLSHLRKKPTWPFETIDKKRWSLGFATTHIFQDLCLSLGLSVHLPGHSLNHQIWVEIINELGP